MVDEEEVVAGRGIFILVAPVPHCFGNRSDAVARFVNVHAPAAFDRRLEDV